MPSVSKDDSFPQEQTTLVARSEERPRDETILVDYVGVRFTPVEDDGTL